MRQAALKTGRNVSKFGARMAFVMLLIFLTAFATIRPVAALFDNNWYTHNCSGGTETITGGGILQTRQSTPGGDADHYGFCTAQRGSFPWGPSPGTALPGGLTNVSVTASFLGRSPVNGSFIGSRYHLYVGFYYYLDVPQSVGGVTHQWMDTQVRIEDIDGADSPIGTVGQYDPGDSFGWNLVVAQLNPGNSYTFSTNVESQFESAVSAYGIPITIGHSLMGIEIGTEGYQIQELDVDWSNVNFNGAPSHVSASFTATPPSPIVGDPNIFSATASGGTGPYTYSWNFGDGSSGTGNPAQHSYSSPGNKTITLTVTDALRASTTATDIIIVAAPAVGATFTFSPENATAGTQVNFSAGGTGGTPPYNYSWSFGDGATGTGQTTSHSYSNPGGFTASLNLTDSGGQTALVSRVVNVYSPGLPDYTILASPSSLAIITGQSGSSTVTLGSLNGFSGTVLLFVTPDSGLMTGLSSNNVTVSPGNPQNVTVTITVFPGTSPGSHSVALEGMSGFIHRSTSLTVDVVLQLPQLNHVPSLTVPGPESATPGSQLLFIVNASDPDPGRTVALSAAGLPSGASFDQTSGRFSWTPLASQLGVYEVTFTATDNSSPPMSETKNVTITVYPARQPASQGSCLLCPVSNFVWANLWWVTGGIFGGFMLAWTIALLRTRSRFTDYRESDQS